MPELTPRVGDNDNVVVVGAPGRVALAALGARLAVGMGVVVVVWTKQRLWRNHCFHRRRFLLVVVVLWWC